MRQALGSLVLVALLAAGCGGDDDGGEGGGDGDVLRPQNGEVTLVADNLEWNADRIEIPAGEEVTIVVDNRDGGIAHNLHIRDLPGGDIETEIEQGPVQQELEVDVGEPGEYDYVCDPHPNMDGTLVVG